jgi:hypothetical protein
MTTKPIIISRIALYAALIFMLPASCGHRQTKATDGDSASLKFQTIEVEDFVKHTHATDDDVPNPVPPPPDKTIGTWKAPIKSGQVAYLEISEDGTAGLYLGDDESDQLYEIYLGYVFAENDKGDVFVVEMNFNLDWYIYESEDGSPITGVPASYKGSYTFRYNWEDEKQSLNVKTNDEADPLFGKNELIMEWTPKTALSGIMKDVKDEYR